MKKEHYIHQVFLLEKDSRICDESFYSEKKQDSEEIQEYGIEYNLFDCDFFCRKINLSFLDEQIDTSDEFKQFVDSINGMDCLFIEDDRKIVQNPIYEEFGKCVISAYQQKFDELGVCCKIIY